MTLRLNNVSTLIRIGAASLLIANGLHFIHPASTLWGSVTDGVTGLAFGVSIGSFLLAVRLNSRRAAIGSCGS